MCVVQGRKVWWDRRRIGRWCGWRNGMEYRRCRLVVQRERGYMLVMVVVVMGMRCVKLMGANGYRMLILVIE